MRDASGVSAEIAAASRVCDPKAGPQQKKNGAKDAFARARVISSKLGPVDEAMGAGVPSTQFFTSRRQSRRLQETILRARRRVSK